MADKPNDYSWEEITQAASALAVKGLFVYQKATCQKCGARLTIDEPNKFYARIDCSDCGHTTDCTVHGGNYMVSTVRLPTE